MLLDLAGLVASKKEKTHSYDGISYNLYPTAANIFVVLRESKMTNL